MRGRAEQLSTAFSCSHHHPTSVFEVKEMRWVQPNQAPRPEAVKQILRPVAGLLETAEETGVEGD